MASPPVTPTLEIETEETLALDTSGFLFLKQEVGNNSKVTITPKLGNNIHMGQTQTLTIYWSLFYRTNHCFEITHYSLIGA